MSKKLAIKGHLTRGKEVIELLEMIGGKNIREHKYDGSANMYGYYIINGIILNDRLSIIEDDDFIIFTLDEFLEKYPFHVGDRVFDIADGDTGIISAMKWDEDVSDMKYGVAFDNGDMGWYTNDTIEFLKEEKNMNKKLAIKRHPTRDKEVIELLEMMGGKSTIPVDAILKRSVYTISEGVILEIPHYNIEFHNFSIFTLEEFLEKYPFKVGDKVTLDNKLCSIIWMCWECNNIYYYVQGIDDMFQRKVTANELKPYKERNMNENKFPSFEPMFKMNDKIEYKIPDGYEITEVSKDTVFIKPIKPQYPKTYKECCDVLLIPPYYNLRYHTYQRGYYEYATSNTLLSLEDKLNTLGKLIICRDAYWKIAGEEMGLGKPWEPDWDNLSTNHEFIKIDKGCFTYSSILLVFPTKEMCDAFFEDFKHLIEQCKKFL